MTLQRPSATRNVLFVCPKLYPDYTGGIEVYNYRLIRWLSANSGLRPVVVTASSGAGLEGIEVIKVRGKCFGSLTAAIVLAVCAYLLRQRRNTVVMHLSYARSHWQEWLFYALLRTVLGVPYVLYVHGGGLYPWRPDFPHRLAFEKAYRLFCVSSSQVQEYRRRRIRRPMEILPPAVPSAIDRPSQRNARAALGIPVDETVLVSVASLKPVKGTDVLLEAFRLIPKVLLVQRNVHLYLFGAGDIPRYRSMLGNEEPTPRVHFCGSIANERIDEVYAAADVFVLSSRKEGLPIALIEAAASRLPCVVPDLPGLSMDWKDGSNCLKFETGDPRSLADRLVRLLGDDHVRAELGMQAGHLYEGRYDAVRGFKRLVSAYREALALRWSGRKVRAARGQLESS